MSHLLTTEDLSLTDFQKFTELASFFENHQKDSETTSGILRGKTILQLFLEDSTRTKISFELAAKRLGANVLHFSISQSSLNKGESLKDTILTLNQYHPDTWIIRAPRSGTCHLLTQWTKSPIVSAGDGQYQHPTQGLLDCWTLLNHLPSIKGKKIVLLGDILHSRVARSQIPLLNKLGAKITLCGPYTLLPKSAAEWEVHVEPVLEKAVAGADAIFCFRLQKERMTSALIPSQQEFHRIWGLTKKKHHDLCPQAWILHPGPVNWGVELGFDMEDHPKSLILEQVRRGLYMRMAVLARVLGKDPLV